MLTIVLPVIRDGLVLAAEHLRRIFKIGPRSLNVRSRLAGSKSIFTPLAYPRKFDTSGVFCGYDKSWSLGWGTSGRLIVQAKFGRPIGAPALIFVVELKSHLIQEHSRRSGDQQHSCNAIPRRGRRPIEAGTAACARRSRVQPTRHTIGTRPFSVPCEAKRISVQMRVANQTPRFLSTELSRVAL